MPEEIIVNYRRYIYSIYIVSFVVAGYELDGLGIESREGRVFPHPSILNLGPTQPPIQ
jgi:hypothetical protein